MQTNWSAIIFLIVFCIIQPNIESRIALRLAGINCICHKRDFCEISICKLKAVKRGVTDITIKIKLLQVPVDNVTLDFGFVRRHNSQGKRILGSTIDACAFWRNKRRNPLTELLYNILEFKKYTNMNHSCPYDHDIIVDGFHMNDDYLGLLPIPAGSFMAYSKWYAYNELKSTISIPFQLIKD